MFILGLYMLVCVLLLVIVVDLFWCVLCGLFCVCCSYGEVGVGVVVCYQVVLEVQVVVLYCVQVVIEFDFDGIILEVNDNFLQMLGYVLVEIQGWYYVMFVDLVQVQSEEYCVFWVKLGCGEFDVGQYCWVGKGGWEIWIQVFYNFVFDSDGWFYKVVKFVIDIIVQKFQVVDFVG